MIFKKNLSKSAAFTLAEVLITLAIIGVVAAMTLPTLIQKNNEKATVTALKKFYSSISQAYMFAKNEYGTPDGWYGKPINYNSEEGADIMLDIMAKYMKTSKICHLDKGCFADVTYKKLDGKNTYNWSDKHARLITSDGMSVLFYTYGNTGGNKTIFYDCMGGKETYGSIVVDINGIKQPNVHGKDTFTFIITEDGVYPAGVPASTAVETLEDGDQVKVKAFPADCNRTNCAGFCESCTAWVIYNENMDYLHCDDLSWDGKSKCK